MEPVIELFNKWGTKHAGLFTFAHSQKHVGLYQKFGFWPRFLTAIMSKPIERTKSAPAWTRFSEVPTSEREVILSACRELTDAIYEGLDVEREIRAVATQKLGDTILLWDSSRLVGLSVIADQKRKPEQARVISSLAQSFQHRLRSRISAACLMPVKRWLRP